MSVNVYCFEDFSGWAILEGDDERVERRIYLRGQCNCDLVLLTRVIEEGTPTFYFYNFICDKDHLKNMARNGVRWFENIKEIRLKIRKQTSFVKAFVDWALSEGVEVRLHKPE